jgi:hypothetical protein
MHSKIGYVLCILLFFFSLLNAQGPIDGYLKGKGNFDLAPSISNNASSTFRGAKGSLYNFSFRSNLVGLFGEYGISKNLDVVGTAAYIITPTQSGFQDGSIFAKYRFWKSNLDKPFRVHALGAIGASFPLSNYKPIVSGALGTRAVSIPARFILQVETPVGLFVNFTTGYTWRLDQVSVGDVQDLRLLRPDYQAIRPAHYSTYLLKIGLPKAHYYIDAWFEWQRTHGGSNYAVDQIEFPQNYGVDYQQIGGTFYYSENQKVGYYLSSAGILGGRNVSQVFRITLGLVIKL